MSPMKPMFGSSIKTCVVAKNLVIISQAEKRKKTSVLTG